MKATLRAECSFNFSELKRKLPEALETFPLAYTKKMFQHCLRYMDGYRKRLAGRLLQYAVKKYRGHRILPAFTMRAFELEYEDYRKEKKSAKPSKK